MENRNFIVDSQTIHQAISYDNEIKNLQKTKATLLNKMRVPSLLVSNTEVTHVVDWETENKLAKIEQLILYRSEQIKKSFTF
ncbi:hypothetical protein [Tenacibaculum sp. 190524A02b]|uniref:hypothetical protein n=1 Tax=Tenacibaculum vairaonense TaxID=3137860 RepID=UPI0031FA71CE